MYTNNTKERQEETTYDIYDCILDVENDFETFEVPTSDLDDCGTYFIKEKKKRTFTESCIAKAINYISVFTSVTSVITFITVMLVKSTSLGILSKFGIGYCSGTALLAAGIVAARYVSKHIK